MVSETQHRILDATERLLGRLGYQKMTIDDIAHAAGVSRRTIYLHFENKEEVALSTIDRIVHRLLERLREIVHSPDTPPTKIRRMLVARVLFRVDSVQDYYLSFHDLFANLRPAYLARRERYFADETTYFAEVIAAGHAQALFDAPNPTARARTLLMMTNALLPYSLSPRELGARDQIEAQVTDIADLALMGLMHRDKPLDT